MNFNVLQSLRWQYNDMRSVSSLSGVAMDGQASWSFPYTSRHGFSNLLEVMDRLFGEGRRAVQGLPSSQPDSPSLPQAFAAVPGEKGLSSSIRFQVVVIGRQRELQERTREELYRIGREAIVNAFLHSQAKQIEAQIEFRPSGLRIIVQDNGSGIDPQVLRFGRDGHWGLSGMKERTQTIGGELRILSRTGGGTQITLFVPARAAYETGPTNFPTGWSPMIPRDAGRPMVSNLGMSSSND